MGKDSIPISDLSTAQKNAGGLFQTFAKASKVVKSFIALTLSSSTNKNIFLTLLLGLALKHEGGIVDQTYATKGLLPGGQGTVYDIKLKGKNTKDYLNFSQKDYLADYPAILTPMKNYKGKNKTLSLEGPSYSKEKDIGSQGYKAMRQAILAHQNNIDTLPNGIETIPGLPKESGVCLGMAKQTLQAKICYHSWNEEPMKSFFLQQGLGSRTSPQILNKLGRERQNTPMSDIAKGESDIAFAVFHGSSHLNEAVSAGHPGTHTIIPIGIASQTFSYTELSVNAESSIAQIIASYCIKFPTFVQNISQNGSRVEDLKASTKQAEKVLTSCPSLISITKKGNTVIITGVYIQHGITVKQQNGESINRRHTEPLATFLSRSGSAGTFFSLTESYLVSKGSIHTDNYRHLDKRLIIGERHKDESNKSQDETIGEMLGKENHMFPASSYPDIQTRKKRTILGMKYLGIDNIHVPYRLYPQLATSSDYTSFYEEIELKLQAEMEEYEIGAINGSYLDKFADLQTFLNHYETIKYPIVTGRTKEKTVWGMVIGLQHALKKREPGLAYCNLEFGNEQRIAEVIEQWEKTKTIQYSSPTVSKQLQSGRSLQINIPKLVEWLLTESQEKYIIGYTNQLLVNNSLPEFYQTAITKLIPEPSFQAIIRKIKERESPGGWRDISSLRKLTKVSGEFLEGWGAESIMNCIHTEGEFQLDTKILAELSRDNYYRRKSTLRMLHEQQTAQFLQEQNIQPEDFMGRLLELEMHIQKLHKVLLEQDMKEDISQSFICLELESFIKKSFNLEYILGDSDKYKKVTEILYVYAKCKEEYADLLEMTNSKGKPVIHLYPDKRTKIYVPDKFVLCVGTSPESIAGLQETIVHMHNSGFPKMCYYLYASYITNLIEAAQKSKVTMLLSNQQYISLGEKVNTKEELKACKQYLSQLEGYLTANKNSRSGKQAHIGNNIIILIENIVNETLEDKPIRDESVGLVKQLRRMLDCMPNKELLAWYRSVGGKEIYPQSQDLQNSPSYVINHFRQYNHKTYPEGPRQSIGTLLVFLSLFSAIIKLSIEPAKKIYQKTKRPTIKQKGLIQESNVQ